MSSISSSTSATSTTTIPSLSSTSDEVPLTHNIEELLKVTKTYYTYKKDPGCFQPALDLHFKTIAKAQAFMFKACCASETGAWIEDDVKEGHVQFTAKNQNHDRLISTLKKILETLSKK